MGVLQDVFLSITTIWPSICYRHRPRFMTGRQLPISELGLSLPEWDKAGGGVREAPQMNATMSFPFGTDCTIPSGQNPTSQV
jgi:hypothetical protein